jgi:proprotein convertase subtilisin/kexin type 5
VKADQNCETYNADICIKCYSSFQLNSMNRCIPRNPNCFSSNNNGVCTACYQGYSLINGNCVNRISDPFCRAFNSDGSCKECSQTYVYNPNTQKCTRVNPNCNSTNQVTFECTSCYPGFVLSNGNCVIGTTIAIANCHAISGSQCLVCSQGYYKTPNNTCEIISGLCNTYDNNTGACTSCHPGYALSGRNCVITVGILNCNRMNGSMCVSCSNRYFLRDNRCNPVSDLCKGYDPNNGACTDCYPGYMPFNGRCEISKKDIHCLRTNNNNICIECSSGYLLINNVCVARNPMCKSDDSQGLCTSCYPGYSLINGNCEIPTNNDPNCVQKSGRTCLYCKNTFYLLNGVCTLLTKNCATYEQSSGSCTSCAANLRLINGDCIGSPVVSDSNCVSANNMGQCIECAYGFYVGKSGTCTLVNTYCQDFNYNLKVCNVCHESYVLQDGDCLATTLGVDPNCQRYSGSYCSICKPKYYMESYICKIIDINCLDFDSTRNICRACRSGQPSGANCI